MKKKTKKTILWGIGKYGGGNLDIIPEKQKVPGICDSHQEMFIELLECNNCEVYLDKK